MSSKRPRHSAERPRPLAFADVKPILIRLERIADSVVVVDARHGVDPFDAVVAADDRLPSRFRETRYPQMQQEIQASRARRRKR